MRQPHSDQMETPSVHRDYLFDSPRVDASNPRHFDTLTGLAFGLLCAESILLGQIVQAWLFAVGAIATAIGVVVARHTGRFLPINSRWILGLAMLCILKLQFFPYEIPPEFQFIRSPFAHELSRFLIGTQLLLLASRDFASRRAALFAQLGWGVLIFGCDIRVPGYRVHGIQITLGFVVLLQALFAMSTRRSATMSRGFGWTRRIVVLLTLIVAISAGSALAVGISRHERQLEWLLTNYLFPDRDRFSSTGFSGRGSLESVTMWQQFESDKVVLQAVCDESPGYVIGRVFDTFETRGQRSEWATVDPSRQLFQLSDPPAEVNRPDFLAPVYGAGETESLHWRPHELWSQSRNRLFVPLDTELIAVHAGHLTYTEGSYSALDRLETGDLHYMAYVPQPVPAVQPAPDQLAICLQTYDGLDSEIRDLAERVFAGCETTEDKCAAVERFLKGNYEYSRQVIRPREVDPLSDFLLRNRRGHCEYFASAAAQLLRLGGVPTLYASGYVLNEQNPVDGSWVARNAHAHAWALAYDEELQRWRIVEATPSDGVPEGNPPGWWESRRQAWSLAWKRWMSRTREVGLLPALGTSISEHWLIPLIALLCAVGVTVLLRRWSVPIELRPSKETATPPKLSKVLKWIDRAAGRQGLTRGQAETLHSFAVRVQAQGHVQVATAYLEYSRLRYSQAVDEQTLLQLRTRIRTLLSG